MAAAGLTRQGSPGAGGVLLLAGDWRLRALALSLHDLKTRLAACAAEEGWTWDLSAIEALDSVGALMLWSAWGRRLPPSVRLGPEQAALFGRLGGVEGMGGVAAGAPIGVRPDRMAALLGLGRLSLNFLDNLASLVALLGRVLLDAGHCLSHPGDVPRKEMSANMYKAGVKAMPVSALVGFLIGVVLCYLSALQLRAFGAETFIVNILGLGIVRELGPVLVAVLVAGRSGSAMTAQLGVMRVTEEIDALATMGVSRTLRLVFPKVAALSLTMPLLVLWTSMMAILGGMITADIQLDIGYGYFVDALPAAVPIANLYIGLTKGLVFGFLIALIACHFGLRVRPNTESLSANTTSSVVTSITVVILMDAVFAIATKELGLPI
ncbi:MAG: ABC transporter permease [Rhodocyclaceae bacterium]|nr:ABC transporter permease [Rhodocyclaceae bacterium]